MGGEFRGRDGANPARGAPSTSKWASGRGGSGDQHQHLQSRGRKRHRREMLASLTGADKEEEEAPSPSTLPLSWHQALGTQGGGLQPSAAPPLASGGHPLPGLLQKSPTCWLAGGVPRIKPSFIKPPSSWFPSPQRKAGLILSLQPLLQRCKKLGVFVPVWKSWTNKQKKMGSVWSLTAREVP